MRLKILQMLEWDELPAVPSRLPSFQEFETIFRRNRYIPLACLLACHRWSALHAPPSPPHVSPPVGEPIASRGVWHGRLRSSSRSFIDLATAEAHSDPSQQPLASLQQPPEPWRPREPEPTPRPPSAVRLVPVGRALFRKRRRLEVAAAPPHLPRGTRAK